MNWIKNNFLGMALSILLALAAWKLGNLIPIVGGPVFGIVLGIIINNTIGKPKVTLPGIMFTAKKDTYLGNCSISTYINTTGRFMIVTAMSAIGLNTDLKKMVSNGVRPILLGLIVWFSVANVSILVQFVTGQI
ncbi:putative sulfate exporter family transporter [Clostridium estertheticum]|uniref:Putative sulfate exporter family transporter n=1 Tax=Clostridium estertheticum TaxID=238834 RepID=A0A5N7IXR9_9CLOT|nr:putative sulfate exporter family transporter [Clostridium estertheticum]MPQ30599.1 putative sulfate exporter family transporter [Clostridium estertheticum]MPQ61275.1 putative sulfate exporter family transporter [Clostridium estertheticum]